MGGGILSINRVKVSVKMSKQSHLDTSSPRSHAERDREAWERGEKKALKPEFGITTEQQEHCQGQDPNQPS
jgi:hypothetical protein